MPDSHTDDQQPSDDSFGSRILRQRLALAWQRGQKISQERLGAMLGEALSRAPITGATVSRWESGDAVPDIATVVAMAKLFGVDPGWLAFGAESAAPPPFAGWQRSEKDGDRFRKHVSRVLALASQHRQALERELESLRGQKSAKARRRVEEIESELADLAKPWSW